MNTLKEYLEVWIEEEIINTKDSGYIHERGYIEALENILTIINQYREKE